MGSKYFEWSAYAEKNGGLVFPADELEYVFLIEAETDMFVLSGMCSELLFAEEGSPATVSKHEFEERMSESGCHAFRQAIQRLMTRKENHVSCHAAMKGSSGYLSSVIYLYRIDEQGSLLGHISIDYEPMREYEQHLEEVIKQLKHTQKVNELMIEGASDYIYQLDVINNICTFSSKALEVLPLETPTFSDAMNRILSFIIPEDRHIFLDSFIPFLSGQSDQHIAEYRVLTKFGDVMWISCKGKGLHDDKGQPIIIAGSLLDITEQKRNQERINKMLYYDELTGLKNRRCFEMEFAEYLDAPGVQGSLLYMNIRKFKLYNELFGHNFGNKVLKEFSYMLNLYFASALGIYRFSGDEFLVHLKESNRQEIMAKLLPFQSILKKTRAIDGHNIYINAAVGVVLYPEHGDSVEELLNNVNQCLYRLTRSEDDNIGFFNNLLGDSTSKRFLIETELRRDIENGFQHYRVVYQPIVRLNPDGTEWIGAEALLRYSNPEVDSMNQIDQMELISILEYSGLILPIGRWVLSQAVHECSKWNRNGNESCVHVNLAAQQISDVGLVQYIEKLCEAEGLSPSHLMIELTETSMLSNLEIANEFCRDLMRLGVGVALDDFGTGYSSFNYLRQLPISQIKIDRGYTHQLSANKYNQTFISFMRQLSQDMQIELCIEGVETEEEIELLRKMQISIIQGFYFERPMEADMICRAFPTSKVKTKE